MGVLAEREGWHLVGPDRNLGFGSGINAAAARAAELGATSYILLNPDAYIAGDGVGDPREPGRRRPVRHDLAPCRAPRRFALRIRDGAGPRHRGGEARARRAPVRSLRALAERCVLGGQSRAVGADRRIRRRLLPVLGGHRPLGARRRRGGPTRSRPRREGRAQRRRHAVDDGDGGKSPVYYFYNVRNRLVFAAQHLDAVAQRRWRRGSIPAAWAILMRGGRRQLLNPRRTIVPGVARHGIRARLHATARPLRDGRRLHDRGPRDRVHGQVPRSRQPAAGDPRAPARSPAGPAATSPTRGRPARRSAPTSTSCGSSASAASRRRGRGCSRSGTRIARRDLDWLDSAAADRIWQIRTAHALHLPPGATPWGEELQSLEPVDAIADRVRAFRERHLQAEPYIGVMVRAHSVSNVQTLEHSPLQWYIDRMRELRGGTSRHPLLPLRRHGARAGRGDRRDPGNGRARRQGRVQHQGGAGVVGRRPLSAGRERVT